MPFSPLVYFDLCLIYCYSFVVFTLQREVAERIAGGPSPDHTLSSVNSGDRVTSQSHPPVPQTRATNLQRDNRDAELRSAANRTRAADSGSSSGRAQPTSEAQRTARRISNDSTTAHSSQNPELYVITKTDPQAKQSHDHRVSSPPSTAHRQPAVVEPKSKQAASIPLALPDRLIQNRDVDARHRSTTAPHPTSADSGRGEMSYLNPTDIASRDTQSGAQSYSGRQPVASGRRGPVSSTPAANSSSGDMYAERPVARGGHSPSRARGLCLK